MFDQFLPDFLQVGIFDVLDWVLVALLMYQVYKLLKGSFAYNIFVGLILLYLIHRFVKFLGMTLLDNILGQFIGVGVIALLIVFQPEVRRFLLVLGRGSGIEGSRWFKKYFKRESDSMDAPSKVQSELSKSIMRMANRKIGALIVLTTENDRHFYESTGIKINADISAKLIETIFQKESPMHDGAVVIAGNRVQSASCVLPVSENPDLPEQLGMRHRAAIGLTENSRAGVVIISEETGNVSLALNGKIRLRVSADEVNRFLQQRLTKEKPKKA